MVLSRPRCRSPRGSSSPGQGGSRQGWGPAPGPAGLRPPRRPPRLGFPQVSDAGADGRRRAGGDHAPWRRGKSWGRSLGGGERGQPRAAERGGRAEPGSGQRPPAPFPHGVPGIPESPLLVAAPSPELGGPRRSRRGSPRVPPGRSPAAQPRPEPGVERSRGRGGGARSRAAPPGGAGRGRGAPGRPGR